jgi:hypothetical protein
MVPAVITSVATGALKHWKLVGLGLLCLALAVQTIRLGAANNRADRIQIHLNEARAELKRISNAKNEQAKRTEGNIEQAERGNKEADDRARKIEEAPLPGNCKTPPEIIGADI